MVSAAVSISHSLHSACNSKSSRRRSNILPSVPAVLSVSSSSASVDDENVPRNRRVACACVAPPQNYQPANFNVCLNFPEIIFHQFIQFVVAFLSCCVVFKYGKRELGPFAFYLLRLRFPQLP